MSAIHLTPAQAHAVDLLEIQEKHRGWARQIVLTSLGIQSKTLIILARLGLADKKTANGKPDASGSATSWRLSPAGENLAARRKQRRSHRAAKVAELEASDAG
jgi:hypothetical protein